MARIFLDVREADEFAAGHVPGAINLPLTQLMAGNLQPLNEVPKNDELIVYCMSGNRSGAASQLLKQHGYTNIINGINQQKIKAEYF